MSANRRHACRLHALKFLTAWIKPSLPNVKYCSLGFNWSKRKQILNLIKFTNMHVYTVFFSRTTLFLIPLISFALLSEVYNRITTSLYHINVQEEGMGAVIV